MRSLAFIPFLTLYTLLCAYVIVRSTQALPKKRWARLGWIAFLVVLAGGFFAGMAFRETVVMSFPLGHWLRNLGVTWIVSLPYWVIATVIWDALRLANRRWHFFPAWIGAHYARAKLLALVSTIASVAFIFGIGYLRFSNPVTTVVSVKIDKHATIPGSASPHALRIAVASDIHLGDVIGVKRLRDYVARINALNPDIILLPGDVIDRSVVPLETQGMGPELAKLRAPLGVYAVLGNHEGYGGAERCAAFLEKYGIRELRDEVVPIANGAFFLAGRIDYSLPRKPLAEVLAGVDRTRPIILMDHQPRALPESRAAGVDLQLSGHTHGGQIWPATWIIPFLFDVSYGYKAFGDFQIYVSSGLGLWGFPARIGSVSEIVNVRVEFAK